MADSHVNNHSTYEKRYIVAQIAMLSVQARVSAVCMDQVHILELGSHRAIYYITRIWSKWEYCSPGDSRCCLTQVFGRQVWHDTFGHMSRKKKLLAGHSRSQYSSTAVGYSSKVGSMNENPDAPIALLSGTGSLISVAFWRRVFRVGRRWVYEREPEEDRTSQCCFKGAERKIRERRFPIFI